MSRIKNKLAARLHPPKFMKFRLDLERCLGVKLEATPGPYGILNPRNVRDKDGNFASPYGGEDLPYLPKEEDLTYSYSCFGAILQAIKKGNGFMDAPDWEKPFDGVFTQSLMGDLRWTIGKKVGEIQQKELGASPEELNQLRLDAIKLCLDNGYIELDSEVDRAKAIELGIIEMNIPKFGDD